MPRPNFEDFRYTGADDPLAIQHVMASREDTYAFTGEGDDDTEQMLATFLATPMIMRGDEIIVRMTEFADENGRPSGAAIDSLLAESTGRRVISTNLPGIDFYGDGSNNAAQELTAEQADDLRKGSFGKVGGAIMQASYTGARELGIESPEFIILGTSMSAAIAASGLRAARERGFIVKGVSFAEPTNTAVRSIPKLATQFIRAGLTANGYAAMNPSIVIDVSEPVATIIKRAAKPTNFLYATALASGSMLQDLGPVTDLEDIPVLITRGAGSSVSPRDGFEALANYLSVATDVQSHTFGNRYNPHDHGYTLTVQSFIDAAKNLIARS